MNDFSVPMPKYSSLSRKRKSKPLVRVGKLGIVRLRGGALYDLRMTCWLRDLCRCQICGVSTGWSPRYDGDPVAYEMAHIKSRGASGSDTLDNVRCLCKACHRKEHGGC